jgi:ubiquinol-cytochrome c reductase cytochrome c1 subunit
MLTDKLRPLLVAGLLLALPLVSNASEGESFPRAGNDVRNTASLQRGARNFMNYCSGCHSAQYVRYNRVAADLGIAEADLKANLMFTSEKPADTIKSALKSDDARAWFGNAPPDLSLIARSRGTDYLYAFLRGFYVDPSRPTGVNNLVLKGTAMPHVLFDLQGLQKPVYAPVTAGEAGTPVIEKLELASKGSLTPEQYDEFVRDTVNFLDYMGEPVQVVRRDLGVWVTLFLLVFAGFAYMMKREYFRDIH